MDTFIVKAKLRRFNTPLSVVTGAVVGGQYAHQLLAYGVPVSLTAGCALAIFAAVRVAVGALLERLSGETYRCEVTGCGFRVRLTGTDAGESRRWQEIALAHPTHNHRH
ncbi:hypothetical protein ACWCZ5_04440 [Streptomyces sp. NPDC001667]